MELTRFSDKNVRYAPEFKRQRILEHIADNPRPFGFNSAPATPPR
jgi:hypothetical protein